MRFKKIMTLALAGALSVSAFALTGCGGEKKLWQYYEDYFKIGCTMNYGTQAQYDDIAGEFNSMTCENEMKWEALEPTEGNFTFTVADDMVAFAKEHGMAVRGHCLAWHNPLSLPSWVFVEGEGAEATTASFEKIKERLVNHATAVVEHFGSDVYAWDVWNEMLTDSYTTDETDLYRIDSGWHNICGLNGDETPEEREAANEKIEELIVATFEAAREAAPADTKLFYNEYLTNNTYKVEKLLTMLDRLLEKGCEIDGVGIQCHYDINNFDSEMLDYVIKEIGKRGLEVQITEYDFSMYHYNNDTTLFYDEFTEDMSALQASCVGKLFEVCRNNKDIVTAVVQWGVADDDSYLFNMPVEGRQDWPYIFDAEHQKKEAYYAIIDF